MRFPRQWNGGPGREAGGGCSAVHDEPVCPCGAGLLGRGALLGRRSGWGHGGTRVHPASGAPLRGGPNPAEPSSRQTPRAPVQVCHCMLFLTDDNPFRGESQQISTEEIQEATSGM